MCKDCVTRSIEDYIRDLPEDRQEKIKKRVEELIQEVEELLKNKEQNVSKD